MSMPTRRRAMDLDFSALDAFLDETDHDGYLVEADSENSDQYYLSGFDAPDQVAVVVGFVEKSIQRREVEIHGPPSGRHRHNPDGSSGVRRRFREPPASVRYAHIARV